MRRALAVCSENDPGSTRWSERSFVGRLTEEGVFERGLYEELKQALAEIGRGRPAAADVWTVLRILERVTLLIGCHLDPNDVYRIANLSDDEVADFNNDFRALLRGLSAPHIVGLLGTPEPSS